MCLSLLPKTVMCIILGRASLKKSSPFLVSLYFSIFNLYDKLLGGERLTLNLLVLLTRGCDELCVCRIPQADLPVAFRVHSLCKVEAHI